MPPPFVRSTCRVQGLPPCGEILKERSANIMRRCEIYCKMVHLGDVMGTLGICKGSPGRFYEGIVNILTALKNPVASYRESPK